MALNMQTRLGPTLSDLLVRHLDLHRTNGQDWPDSAEYCVVFRYSTWPVGWETELNGVPRRHVEFFDTREELDAWVKKQHEWMRLEDNYVAYQGYTWDWGPVELPEVRWLSV